MNILTVCEGNVARSQFLEAIISYWIKYISFSDDMDYVRSVGIDPNTPDKYVHPIKEVSDIVEERLGMKWEPQHHTVDLVTEQDMQWADVVFVLYDEEKAEEKFGASKEYQMLKNSKKVIYLNGIRDPHSGTIEQIDWNEIGIKLGKAFSEIYKMAQLYFPIGYEEQKKALRELSILSRIEYNNRFDKKAHYEEYIAYKNKEYRELMGDYNKDVRSNIPSELYDDAPKDFRKERLEGYENRLSLMILLYSCKPELISEILGNEALEWVNEQKIRYTH